MTKERKLAIAMWLWIREHYAEWNDYFWGSSNEDGFVEEMKFRFLDTENNGECPAWSCMCWLCQYVRKSVSCKRCPLTSCSASDSAFRILETHTYKDSIYVTEEVYRDCCSTIVNALGYKGE